MSSNPPSPSSNDRSPQIGQTFLYFGALTFFVYLALPNYYLLDFQTSYMLKNQLGATRGADLRVSADYRHSHVPRVRLRAGARCLEPLRIAGPRLLSDLWRGDHRHLYSDGVFAVSYRTLYVGMFLAMLLFPIRGGGVSGADGPGRPGETDVRTPGVLWQCRQYGPARCRRIGFRVHLRPSRVPIPLSRWRRHSPAVSACWDSGSRVPYSAMPTTSRRPRARICLGMSSGW